MYVGVCTGGTCGSHRDLPSEEIMPWSTLESTVDGENDGADDPFTFGAPENEAFGFPKPMASGRLKPSGTSGGGGFLSREATRGPAL